MSRSPTVVRALGYLSLALFLVMAIILQLQIAPHVSFLPQAELGRYSDQDLMALADDLLSEGLSGLYKMVLLRVDIAFITVFGLWAILVHVFRASGVLRWFGIALTLAFMVLDYREDLMLAQRMGFVTSDAIDRASFTEAVSAVHLITLSKYSFFVLSVASVFFVSRRQK